MRGVVTLGIAALTLVATACAGAPDGDPDGSFELPASEAEGYETAYLAVVVADPEGDDLARGAGEHVVIRNRWDHQADLGGWAIEDAEGNRLRLGIGRQVAPNGELRVHSSCGEDSDVAVFACLDEPVLDDGGDVLRLLDAAGNEVARFSYGTAS